MFRRLFGFGSRNEVRKEPFGATDLVQVTVHTAAVQIPPLAAGASDAPLSWTELWGSPNLGTSEHVRDIRDEKEIGALLEFVNDRLSGWYDRSPVPTIRAYFWKEKSLMGIFGAGRNFFSRGEFPAQRIIGASPDELGHFYRLVHLGGMTYK